MIEHELLLLGLLSEGPKHGYEIKTKIKEILSIFAGIRLKSIYYPLKVLEKRGLVEKNTAKLGRRPERLVYKLTEKGKTRFKELLNKSFLDLKRPQFSLDLSLYFLHYLKPDITRRRLRARQRILRRIAVNIKQTISSLPKKKDSCLSLILEHNLQMLEAELSFLKHLLGQAL
ncbi:MAG TPA: PadR family transcriptional regulator [Candidatus Omnitrophota bacterium]|nr:PadR family transcriptional regulator [Candidatus Omnitrophota bacterium]